MAYLDTLPVDFETYDTLYYGEISFGECRDKGEAVLAYINKYDEETAGASTRYITFKSPNGDIHEDIPIVNASHWGTSSLVSKISQGHKFGMGWFRRKDGKYQFSVRVSDESDFDASKLCVDFGGGGHVKASGFTLDHEIKELP